jgi:hypothetical protein
MVQTKHLKHYMGEFIQAKIPRNRKKQLKTLERNKALAQIGRTRYGNIFEGLEGEDFEVRSILLH